MPAPEYANYHSCLTDSKFEEKVDTGSAPALPDTPKIGASNEIVAQVSMFTSTPCRLEGTLSGQQFHGIKCRAQLAETFGRQR
jgi:hypothetical protein